MKTTKTLEMEVMEILENMIDNDYTMEMVINDILTHGCISGIVGELIYYHQTEEFFNKHKDEINELAHELSKEIYGDPFEIYKNLQYGCDKNQMAWFGFEEMVRIIANEMEIEY